jgi:hypothetical protein
MTLLAMKMTTKEQNILIYHKAKALQGEITNSLLENMSTMNLD